jgi:hypothetical protein
MIEQPFSRILFYLTGSLWFVTNIFQRGWKNQVHYSILEEIRIMNKLQLGQIKKEEMK